MIPGELYIITNGEITMMPDAYFLCDKSNLSYADYENFVLLTAKSKPNIFIFLKHVFDEHNIKFSLILYKSTSYVIQNEYHNGNLITKV